MASLALVFDLLARDNASQAFRQVGDEAEKAGRKTSAFGSLTGKAMAAAAGAIAGVGIGAVLGNAVKAASDLNETVNRTNVIFGANAREVRSWAEGSARNFGLSEQAALDAASGFGNMLTQLGYTGDAALDASTGVVELAADLGSFNNLETGDVLERISAAMRGEYDSLQLLIPNINAARVEQEALAATGKTAADSLTAQEKAAATLAIVQRDGAAAAGDFAETSDGLANSQKILNAEWQDAQAKLGGLLVGPMTGMVQLLTDGLIPAFETTVDVLGAVGGFFAEHTELAIALGTALAVHLAGGVTAVTVAFNRLILTNAVLGLSNVLGVVLDLPGALRKASGAVAGFIAATAPLAAVGGVVYALTEFASNAAAVEERLEAAADAGKDFGTVLAQQNGQINATTREAAELAFEAAGLAEAFEDAGITSQTLTGALTGNEEAFEETLAAAKRLDAETSLIGNSWGLLGVQMDVVSGRATANADALLELVGATGKVSDIAEEVANGYLPLFGETFQTIGEQASSAATATEEASVRSQEAIDEWREHLQGINESFIGPLEVYKGLLDEKTAKEREAAEATAASTDSATDSWEDYVEDVSVSLDEYATQLEEQLVAQEQWRTNLVLVSQRGGAEVAAILADMGVEGAQITADMANATEEDFQRMKDALIRESNLAGEGATNALDTHMRVMAAVGASGGRATATSIARELGIGVQDVLRIASQYGVNLATGINPVLASLGKPIVQVDRLRGGFTPGFADGGYTGQGGKYTPAGIVHAGEFVVPMERVNALGGPNAVGSLVGMPGYAGGGFVSTAAVPKPPSTGKGPPISTAGDAAMAKLYGDTVDWLEANLIPPAAALSGPGKWNEMFAAVQRAFPDVVLHSGFRPGSITATGNLSYHALGRAIDISPRMDIFNWLAANYPGSRELIFSPAGGRQRWNGAPHMYSEPTRGDHWDHIHWAMANGGIIREPVVGMGLRTGASYSFGERGPETVVPWDMSGGRSGGGGGTVNVQPPVVKVYLDGQEWRGMARVEAEGVTVEALSLMGSRGRFNG